MNYHDMSGYFDKEICSHIHEYLDLGDRISIAVALTASIARWKASGWQLELTNICKILLYGRAEGYDPITNYTLPRLGQYLNQDDCYSWPTSNRNDIAFADNIAAYLGCIEARANLRTLSVPTEGHQEENFFCEGSLPGTARWIHRPRNCGFLGS